MGANIELDESMCYINGKTPLKGAKVEATDLRCGAALLIAGLIADGITEISNVYHICLLYTSCIISFCFNFFKMC